MMRLICGCNSAVRDAEDCLRIATSYYPKRPIPMRSVKVRDYSVRRRGSKDGDDDRARVHNTILDACNTLPSLL